MSRRPLSIVPLSVVRKIGLMTTDNVLMFVIIRPVVAERCDRRYELRQSINGIFTMLLRWIAKRDRI
jgi:hypothetical protein